MSARIFQNKDEIRFEATDTLHVFVEDLSCPLTSYRPGRSVVTIQEFDEDEISACAPGQINMWASDIDALIDALLDLKREIKNATGE